MKIIHYGKFGMLNIPHLVSIVCTDFIQISIIHDNICKLIYKKCLRRVTAMTKIPYDTKYNVRCSYVTLTMLSECILFKIYKQTPCFTSGKRKEKKVSRGFEGLFVYGSFTPAMTIIRGLAFHPAIINV